ncbi:MAG: hypothetical protein GVY33_09005 [Alphaproteobacteria bacterium]|jgi:hypothetical protein|nr:hypothetical protein [Alphaproteobacteria bacterium]
MAASDEAPRPVMSAADLRRRMAEIQLAKIEELEAERRKLEQAHLAQVEEFMKGGIDAGDAERIRYRVAVAIENGQGEVEVLRFPASLLADRGRAVNNFDPSWPSTLVGKAAVLYRLFEERAAPLGYKLDARVLNYPDGKPGEVGLFLRWV